MVTVNIVVTDDAVQPEIYLGRQGEKQAREIVFDLSALREKYGAGTATLYHQRSKDPAPYLIAETTGTTMTWTVSETDTVYAGIGYCEFRYTFGTEGLSKSAMFATNVKASLSGDVIIPSATQAWYDALIEYIDEHSIAQDQLAQAVADYIEAHPLEGLPSGGTEGQIIVKKSGTDFDTEWGDGLSDLKSALNDNVNGIITGEKVKSYTFPWVDGGINASTGALNTNAYAIRTSPVQFNVDSITIDDSTRNNIWRLYWVSYSDETAISTSKVDSSSFANSNFPVTLSIDPNLYYRFMYFDASSTARPSADGLTMVGNTSEPFQIQYVPDVVKADVDGIKQIVSLSSLTWVAGRISSSGADFNGAGYAYRTNDYYEFENEIVTVQDANANHANYTLTLYGYDKETSAFVTGVVWPYTDVANKRIRVNTAYKYRFMYLDTTSTEMPDYTKLSLDYGYTSNSFASVNKELESLSDADPFRVKNAIRKPRVTFIDDDGHIQFYRLIYPLMVQKGVPYCVAYMANEYPYYPGNLHMTYAQCQDVVDAGGEILGHGTTDLTTLSLEAAETDVTNTKAILEQYGFNVKGYVYPSGGSNPSVREMIAKHYAYGMKTNEAQQVYRVNTNCVPSYYINRCNNGGYYDAQTGDYANVDTASLDYMKSVIDECVSQNGWLIFVSHAAYMPEGSRRPGYENVDQVQLLSDTIDYILSLKNGGTDVDIVTASEAFAMFGNAYEAGDYLGYWNESQNYHTVPGCAISKEGKWDFPDSQRITHS